MKKVKGKYIRLTEAQLDSIIKTKIDENIKRILAENADPRKDVIKRLKNYFSQLAENWCLVHYCTLANEDVNRCKNHWQNELWAILSKMSAFKLQGNNSYESRMKVIKTAEGGQEILSDFEIAYGNVIAKFAKVNITNKEMIERVVNDLLDSKESIITIIASANKDEIFEYINNI